jgi:hypothetical protein
MKLRGVVELTQGIAVALYKDIIDFHKRLKFQFRWILAGTTLAKGATHPTR